MPRARKKKSVAVDPVAVAEPVAQRPEPEDPMVTAFKAQREREQSVTEPVRSDHDTNVGSNGQATESAPGKHAAAVLSERPVFGPVPNGYFPVASDRRAGIRVSKKIFRDKTDGLEKSIAAIQFAENRLPDRSEKDILERVGHPPAGQNFTYKAERRQWERVQPEGWPTGENTIDAHRVMEGLAASRNEGRGR